MSADPEVKSLPRPPAPTEYDETNERRFRATIDRELGQKHDMRADLRVGVGKSLVLSAPSGLDYAFGLDDDGFVTVTNYESGAVGTLVIKFASVQGLQTEFDAVRSEFATADGTLSASVSTNATAIATLEGAAAVYEVIAAASGSQPARIRLKAGLGGATIELDADEIYFGAQTSFDLSTETFITEVGGVRSRYGTAFGSGASVVMWHGPTSVAQGDESRTNGYLAIGTDGLIYHNAAALSWGATAAEAAASNLQVGTGANSLVDTGFRAGTTYWVGSESSATGSIGTPSVLSYASGIRILQAVGSGFAAADQLSLSSKTGVNALPVQAGDRVGARALIGGASLTNIRLRLFWYNSAGAFVSSTNGTIYSSSIPDGAGETDHFIEATVVGTAPATAASCILEVLGIASGASPRVRIAFPTLAKLPAGQTAAPPLSLGLDATRGADITASNTAAAITGQGLLALGNFYEQSADPGSVANGSLWAKTGTKELFIRVSSTWKKIANIGADLALSLDPSSVYSFGSPLGPVTGTATGGSGGYTYAWTKVSGDTFTVTSPTSASTTFTKGSVGSAVYRLTVTDSLGATAYQDISITLDSI